MKESFSITQYSKQTGTVNLYKLISVKLKLDIVTKMSMMIFIKIYFQIIFYITANSQNGTKQTVADLEIPTNGR